MMTKRNLMNVIAPEPVKRFQPNFTQTFSIVGPHTLYILKYMGSRVKLKEDIFQKCIV